MLIKHLKIRRAKIDEKNKITKFISKSFYRKNHILVKNSKLFKWQYINNYLSCSIALFKSKIVGLQFYIPLDQFDTNLKINKEFFNSLWLTKKTNIIFLGAKIFDFTIKSLKPKLIIAMGLPSSLINFHLKKKFTIKKMQHSFILSPFIKNNVLKIDKKIVKNSKRIKIVKIISRSELNKLNVKQLFKFQYPIKSNTYLVNRFILHPIYKYYLYHINFNKNKCICVFRIVKLKRKKIIRIVEFIGSNNSFKILNNFFIFILKKYNADYLDFYSFGIPKKILKISGLYIKDDFKNLIIPDHFEPFENKNIDIVIGYLSRYKNNSKIRLFKADSDTDRPNL